ncbi:Xaa-Pro dipeptidase [Geobacter sp. OR-1]|uniref:M24 family metallopeptidase n=1 Tax=Geobacter sp. OR-1 TaxID=1266765 RepID=UPI0005432265|nr:Xaa-Pro peptidase family protein [Geobacter sp. OR-1]GAM07956.1 Xaa-Pro dipeptidase [Geobacter sp. OR-1]
MRITPTVELEHRCHRLQLKMAEEGLDAVIILQNADLFYFTGTIQSGCLYVPATGQPLYLVRRDVGRARMECGLKEVVPFGSPKDLPRILAEFGYPEPKSIAMEFDVVPVLFYERYRKVFPQAAFSDATPLIRMVRMIKSAYEIHIMKDAADQVDKVYRRATEVIKEGITDIELAAELEYTARRNGHLGHIRMRVFNGEMIFGHTISGTDSAVPAYTDTPLGGVGPSPAFGQGASFKPIAAHEPIIVDFAGSIDGYLVDQTRVFAIGGLPEQLVRAYEDMVKVQELMIELAPARPTWGALYESCRKFAEELGYTDSFMGSKGAQVSFIGHGIGVEIDEYPFIARGFDTMSLEPGMAFAFEPKVVLPGLGAVGIEDTFYLAGDGTLKQLTYSDPRLVIL